MDILTAKWNLWNSDEDCPSRLQAERVPNGTLPDGVPTGEVSNGAEIDIIEVNRVKDEYATAIHWDGYGDDHKSNGKSVSAPELHDKEWHTFGLQWNDDQLHFYYDGTEVDGEIETSKWPDVMFVDYVRVWQYK